MFGFSLFTRPKSPRDKQRLLSVFFWFVGEKVWVVQQHSLFIQRSFCLSIGKRFLKSVYRPEVKYSPQRCTVFPALYSRSVVYIIIHAGSLQLWQHYTPPVPLRRSRAFRFVRTPGTAAGDEHAKLIGRTGIGEERRRSVATSQ